MRVLSSAPNQHIKHSPGLTVLSAPSFWVSWVTLGDHCLVGHGPAFLFLPTNIRIGMCPVESYLLSSFWDMLQKGGMRERMLRYLFSFLCT